jgi:hypothetical protein
MGALLLVVLTVGQAVPPSIAEAPPESGMWYIDGDEVLRDGTYYFNDSVTINSSGSLTIENALLIFNSPNCVFYVHGALEMDKTRLSTPGSQLCMICLRLLGEQSPVHKLQFLGSASLHRAEHGLFTGLRRDGR